MECLVKGTSMRNILLLSYKSLLYIGKVSAIECLSKEEKDELWEFTKEIAAGRITNNEDAKDLSRALYILNYLMP
jgi:dihydrodipicolinate synthase/N-acetylneuraminate lyase